MRWRRITADEPPYGAIVLVGSGGEADALARRDRYRPGVDQWIALGGWDETEMPIEPTHFTERPKFDAGIS